MVTAFADTSALVKLYVPEAGSSDVRDHSGPLVMSALARVEAVAAFWGKQRMGEIAPSDAAVLTDAFETDAADGSTTDGRALVFIPVTASILDAAARACGVHGLRAYDAVQLATAEAARLVDPDCSTMVVFDRALAEAARAEGFSIVPDRGDAPVSI